MSSSSRRPPVRRLGRLSGSLSRALAGWVLPIAMILVWEIAAPSGRLSSRILPAPSQVAAAGWASLLDGTLITHTVVSAQRVFVGLAIGGSIGFALGVLNGVWRPAETAVDSSLQMLRNIPHLAIIPLVILWFGIEEEAKVFLVAIGVMFPIYLNTFHGIRTVDPGLVEMARVCGLGPVAVFTRVILPGALPSVLVGLRYALGIMWLTLIVAETISASSGIGYMSVNAREFQQTDVVLLGIIVYALLGKLADVGVEKASGPRRVLAGIDLTVPPGGFVAVVGRSGGGKSTLMRLLCGLDRATRGEVIIGGRVVSGIDPAVRLMFQDARLLSWQTVLSNAGISRGPDWHAAARVALADVGLANRERDWPAVLSGGQRQRVALARALVGRPGVLLLDEPFGALDALTRAEMHVLLDRLWRARRFAAVLITHDVTEAVALADRVLVLADGRVAADVPVPLARDDRTGPAAAAIRDRILAAV